MWYSLVRIAIILALIQCIQGVVRHFDTKQRSESIEYSFHRSRSDNKIHFNEIPQPRARRQGAGGEPEAVSSFLPNDNRQFGRISYSGEGSKVLYVLTYDLGRRRNGRVTSSALYRSDDYGQTFVSQASKLRGGFLLNPNIYRFPSDNRIVIFADDASRVIYVTTDEGETFDTYDIPVDPTTIKPHPTMPGWLLGHDPLQGVLMFSGNFGVSWNIVARGVHPPSSDEYTGNDFVWGEPGIDWDVNNPSQLDLTTVFYNVYETDGSSISGNNRMFYVAINAGSGYTSQLFDCNLGHFDSFILDGSYIFAGQFNSSFGRTQLHVSYMRNPFNLTRIPTIFSQYSYLVGSHRSSQALVIVEHAVHYSLYLSDETGTFYSLSLQDLVYGSDGSRDLEIIDSVDGTMIANQYVDISILRVQTVISFDNGARWNRIASPAYDFDGLPTNCSLPQCSLHFHLDSSVIYRRLGVYSRNSAPGIIVAHGNRGSFLFNNDISVYISRDGGLTWNQTLDSSWDIEIIDHGGLLVAARDHNQNNSMSIRYSCDEGMSWSDFSFTNTSVTVWGVITEPGQTTTQVLLFSRHDASPNWMTTHLNFTSIFSRTCQPSDYYQWFVSDGRIGSQACLLGEARVIERRKPSVCCWNSRQYERVMSTTPCLCTAADFECEWGYYRDSSGNCILNGQFGPQLECLTGYRKIAGDVCMEGVSENFLPPSDCVFNTNDSSKSDCGPPVTPVPDNGHNNTIKNDSSSSSSSIVNPTPDSGGNINNTGNTGKSTGNNRNTAVAASVTVIVLLITLGTIIIVILGIAYFIRKRKNITPTSQQPDDLVTMPKAEVVGGDMRFKKLIEDE